MNKVELIGRLTKNPTIRYSKSEPVQTIALFVLAVNRTYRQEGSQNTDFIYCCAVGKRAEFIEKYFVRGLRVSIVGHIQSNSYISDDGTMIYRTEVFVEEAESMEKLRGTAGMQTDPEASVSYPEEMGTQTSYWKDYDL